MVRRTLEVDPRVDRRLNGVAAGSGSAPLAVDFAGLDVFDATLGVLLGVPPGDGAGVGAVLMSKGVLTTGDISDRIERNAASAEVEVSDAETDRAS